MLHQKVNTGVAFALIWAVGLGATFLIMNALDDTDLTTATANAAQAVETR